MRICAAVLWVSFGLYAQQVGVLERQEPQYSEEARILKVAGEVTLTMTVGTDGEAHDLRVTKSLGLGLDEKAVEAVSRWKFQPGEKEGSPVPVVWNVMINFRLISTSWHVAAINFDLPEGAMRPTAIKASASAADLPENWSAVVAFDVDDNGIPINVHTRTQGNPKSEATAISIVSGWQFKPATVNGRAVSVPCTVELRRGDPPAMTANFPPPAPGVRRIRITQNVQAANLVNKVEPKYSSLETGAVRFDVLIGQTGNVESLQVASGHPLLVQAAMDAVRQWTYRPTLLNGNPVEVITQVDVNFTLH